LHHQLAGVEEPPAVANRHRRLVVLRPLREVAAERDAELAARAREAEALDAGRVDPPHAGGQGPTGAPVPTAAVHEVDTGRSTRQPPAHLPGVLGRQLLHHDIDDAGPIAEERSGTRRPGAERESGEAE